MPFLHFDSELMPRKFDILDGVMVSITF